MAWSYPLLGVVILLCVASYILSSRLAARSQKQTPEHSIYNDIAPDAADWQTRPPAQIRNFKDVYHLTMGLQSCTLNDLILMDESYSAKIELRRHLIAHNFDDVIGCNPVAAEAVAELYRWLFTVYLPRRWPNAFRYDGARDQKVTKTGATARQAYNLVTGEVIPLDDCYDTKACLATIGRHIDCEFAILLPASDGMSVPFPAKPSADPATRYYLHAFVLAFPSGFTTARKLGMSLADIHGPVPGYAAKLEKSMDKYFATLPFGKIIQRTNWAVSTDGQLFKLGTEPSARDQAPTPHMPDASAQAVTHLHEASKPIDPIECFLRSERQTLHRLERSGALVFGFKTFLEPIEAIKQEGLGTRLAQAFEGLRQGSVPAMDVYKDGVVWRKPLVDYLIS